MKKKLIALVMAASMVMGTGAVATAGEPINDLVNYVTDTTLLVPNYMLTQGNSSARSYTANYMEGLVGMDDYGNLTPALALSWEYNSDATECTFKLREGVQWVNYQGEAMGEVTSKDFLTGFEWLMNAHKGKGTNNNLKDYVIGAQDYYDKTVDMDDEEAWALGIEDLVEIVGIETPDDYTVTYKLLQPSPAFHTFAASAYLWPLAAGYVEACGTVEKALEQNLEDLWYSGAYIPVEYVEKNNLTLKPNPLYWDTECQRFDSLTYIVVSDAAQAYLLFENGEIDQVTLQASTLKAIYEDEGHKYHDYLVECQPTISSYQIHFNYAKINEDGTYDENWNRAIANENFRKAFYYGVDWMQWLELQNFINPMNCDFNTYTLPGIARFSDGTDYASRVEELLGVVKNDAPGKSNPEKAAEYKAAAMEELTAQGVTFPIDFVYHVGGSNQTEQDQGLVVKQMIEEGLGTDFITVEIDTYVSSWTGEIIGNKLQCIGIVGLSAKLGDSTGLIVAEDPRDPSAMFSPGWSHTYDILQNPEYDYHETLIAQLNEFADLLEAAEAIVDDPDARLEASAKAEAYYLEHALCVPLYRKISWQLTKVNDWDRSPTLYGSVWNIYKDVETNSDMYTTAEWAELKAAKEANE